MQRCHACALTEQEMEGQTCSPTSSTAPLLLLLPCGKAPSGRASHSYVAGHSLHQTIFAFGRPLHVIVHCMNPPKGIALNKSSAAHTAPREVAYPTGGLDRRPLISSPATPRLNYRFLGGRRVFGGDDCEHQLSVLPGSSLAPRVSLCSRSGVYTVARLCSYRANTNIL